MAGKTYVGVNNIAKSPSKIYVGVNDVAKEVKAIYVGDSNGIARKVFPNSLIPDTYQRVEYIQNAAGFDEQGYIDTGFRPNTYTRIVATYSDHGPVGSTISVFSYLQEKQPSSGSNEYYHIGFGSSVSSYSNITLSPSFYFGPSSNSTYFQSSWDRTGQAYDDPYVYDLNNNRNIIFDNVAFPYQTSNIVNFSQSNSTLIIFGRKFVDTSNNVTLLDYEIGIRRLYSFKIYSNYTTLVRDFYPCYKKSDRTPGLYDTVTGVFYTNAVSGGIFPVGDDVNT